MSADEPIPPGEEPALLAAEHVLGLLEGPARAAAEARIEADPEFARLVDLWAERLAPLLDGTPERAPPASLWAAIERGIDAIAAPAAANIVGLRRRVTLWRGYGIAATAVAAALVGAIVTRPPVLRSVPPVVVAPGHAMVATLADTGGAALMMASFEPAAASLTLAPTKAVSAAAGRSHELWLIPAGGVPHALGVMPAGACRLTMPHAMVAMVGEGATLAVSLEPAGGSLTGAPTGPVLASGKFIAV